jgi:hypothetical protein
MRNFSRSWRDLLPVRGHLLSRPVVLFHSDDWGLVGIRDREVFEELRAQGLPLGRHPYDYYSLETREDLLRLYEVLSRHKDSLGRPPCCGLNFVTANVDFEKVARSGFSQVELRPLDQGLPGRWSRQGLVETYREGVEEGLIHPGFHGLTHFCRGAAQRVLASAGERGRLLRTLYAAESPFLHYPTPWVGYEYQDASVWLDRESQRRAMGEGIGIFQRIFGTRPHTACAPGYRANEDTLGAWKEEGLKVVQNGPGERSGTFFHRNGLLVVPRNVVLEPALDPRRYDERAALQQASLAFAQGHPAVVSIHSINFHSTLIDYRNPTLQCLDRFLTQLEERYDSLLYLHDYDLWQIVTGGELNWRGRREKVSIHERRQPSPAWAYYQRKMKTLLARPVFSNINQGAG